MSFGLNNAPETFLDLINGLLKKFIDSFVIVFIHDVLVYSNNEEEYADHLCIFLVFMRNMMYSKIFMCEFLLTLIALFGHIVS